MTPQHKTKIEELLNTKIKTIQSVGGGCIANACQVLTEKEEKYFYKSYSNNEILKCEINGLNELHLAKNIKIPKVIIAEDDFALMEFINQSNRGKNFFETFGRSFAQLHKYSSDNFGFYENNFIGANRQVNQPISNNWTEFYFQNRLLYQFKLAEKNGYVDNNFRDLFYRLENRIDSILTGCENIPSLLHGDLWSGNYLCDENGAACLIDPAVYYGNREADLAMTKLFGGFDTSFYSAYNEEYKLPNDWKYRENIFIL